MNERTLEDDPRMAAILERLRRLEARVTVIEERGDRTAAGRDAIAPALDAATPARAKSAGESLSLIGRTLVVLGGAFLLRALTEAELLPRQLGPLLGLVYAAAWLVLADRAAAAGRRASATFHGVAAALVAFPLVWESTVKFALLPPAASVAALASFTLVGLAVAARRRIEGLAWVVSAGAAATSLSMAIGTRQLVSFAGLLLLLGWATLWLSHARGWAGPGWLAAASANALLALIGVTAVAARTTEADRLLPPVPILLSQLALVAIYCGSLARRAVVFDHDVTASEVVQAAAACVVGLGGAVAVTLRDPSLATPVAAVSVLLAAACYAAAFAVMDRASGKRASFVFFTTLGLGLMLLGVHEALSGAPRIAVLAALGGALAWIGSRRERATLSLHGATYTAVAAAVSGLLAASIASLAAPAFRPGGWTPVMGLVLAAAAGGAWLPVAIHGRTWGRFSRLPRLALLLVAALGLAGGVISLSIWAVAGPGGEGVDRGALATIRTGVLASAAVGLAMAGRSERFVEARWLVYPVLVAGGVKLITEDLRAGRAVTLFASLALYGGALIVAPRLARRGEAPLPG